MTKKSIIETLKSAIGTLGNLVWLGLCALGQFIVGCLIALALVCGVGFFVGIGVAVAVKGFAFALELLL